jgi:hypothetical protein
MLIASMAVPLLLSSGPLLGGQLGAQLALPVPVEGELVHPGCISSAANETSLAVRADRREYWFARSDFASRRSVLLRARIDEAGRCSVDIAPMASPQRDSEPHLSPDGNALYFVSSRPRMPGELPLRTQWNGREFAGTQIWRSQRGEGEIWTQPTRLPGTINESFGLMLYNPSTDRVGAVYFSAHREDSGPGYQIYRSGPDHTVQRVELGDLQRSRMDPAIDPEGRYLIYAGDEGDSLGSADLYLAIIQPDGRFGTPIRLPAGVNTPWLENAPSLGPDFGELYLTSARPVHWQRPGDDLRGAPLPESADALQAELLDQPLNGSRNLWRFDIGDWARAHGLQPQDIE